MMDASPTTLRAAAQLAVMGAISLAAVACLLTVNSLAQAVSAEEQAAIAAGAVTARQGLWPVLDYPYFEMPMWPLTLAGLFAWCDPLLLGSRLLAVAAATTTAGLLMGAALAHLHGRTATTRFALAGVAALWLVCSPIYTSATGWALPGDVAATCMIASLLCGFIAMRAGGQVSAAAWALITGLTCGLATSLVPVYALASAVLLLLLPLAPAIPPRRRTALLSASWAGAAAALAPTAWLWRQHPDMFWFATSELPLGRWISSSSLEMREVLASPSQRAMLEAVGREPLMWIPLAAFVALAGLTAALAVKGGTSKRPSRLLLQILIVVLGTVLTAGAGYLSTPSGPSQWSTAMPLAVLGMVLCAAYLRGCGGQRLRVAATTVYTGAALAVIVPSIQQWSERCSRFQFASTPVALHLADVAEVREAALGGHVLTLEPALALEAGANVYLPLLPGPSSWRWSSSMSESQRQALGLITPSQMGTLVKQAPPAAVMVGRKPGEAEQPLRSYAHHHRYRSRQLLSGSTLWVAPPHAPATVMVESRQGR